MAGLGETTAGLARLRKAMGRASAGAGDGGDAGLTEVRGFGANPGALRMLTYVPQGLPAGAPLVVVLHGCTQRAGAHARAGGWLTLADRLGFAILAPEQDAANNPNRCFNWFEPGDIARDAGEAGSIHAMVQHMIRIHGLDASRVFVTGLSAGGAMTAVMLAAYPETFAAGAVVAGLPYGVAGNVPQAFAAMRGGPRLSRDELAARMTRASPAAGRRPRLAIWHGLADTTVASRNAEALAQQWTAAHGIAEPPDDVGTRGRWRREVWRAPDGEVLIEVNLLAGLGHGTPLAAGGEDPIGEPAPFMLEAGVSSSLEIARFWGLAAPEDRPQAESWSAAAQAPEPSPRTRRLVGDTVMAQVSPHVPEKIAQVIAKALKSAGLMG